VEDDDNGNIIIIIIIIDKKRFQSPRLPSFQGPEDTAPKAPIQ
jgi:hypothetical protein